MVLLKKIYAKFRYLFLVIFQNIYNFITPGYFARKSDKIHFYDTCNNFFDKIYVLTLERNSARQDFIKQSLKGLRYEFFYGVDGKLMTENDINQVYSAERNKSVFPFMLTPNYIACSLSHAKLYEKIIKENIKNCLILEDDAYIERPHLLSALLKNLPRDWDIIRLGFGQEYALSYFLEPFEGLVRVVNPHFTCKKIRTRKATKYLRIAAHHSCTVAYAITYEGAKKLLSDVYPIATIPDHFIDISGDKGLVKVYHAVPRIFNEATETLGSSILMTGLNAEKI